MVKERRRCSRITFRQPIRGTVGPSRIYVLDASPFGIGVTHTSPLPPPGEVCRVELVSDLGPIRLDCAIIRTSVEQLVEATTRTFYRSGLQVLGSDNQSAARLRGIADKKK
ncbi:MAG: PilZ domain-containing protein [Thermoanaerobaculia bacterium]